MQDQAMNRIVRKALLLLVIALLFACGGNSSSDPGENQDSSSSGNGVSSSSSCTFSFGAGWHQAGSTTLFRGMDHLAVWIGDNDFYNPGWEGRMVDTAIAIGATPVFYAYVIAEYAKDYYDSLGTTLTDCDEYTPPNLCTHGANVIRERWDAILARYATYAKGLNNRLQLKHPGLDPATFRSVWLIEPDLYQYSVSGDEQSTMEDQVGGGIPDSVIAAKFSQIVDTILAYQPSAQISIDISPWIHAFSDWYALFDLSRVTYAHTSGGNTQANQPFIRGRNQIYWAAAAAAIGKPIIADDGYGVAGAGQGHAEDWDQAADINNRIEDGVVAITQMDAAMDYAERLDTIRPKVNGLPFCPSP